MTHPALRACAKCDLERGLIAMHTAIWMVRIRVGYLLYDIRTTRSWNLFVNGTARAGHDFHSDEFDAGTGGSVSKEVSRVGFYEGLPSLKKSEKPTNQTEGVPDCSGFLVTRVHGGNYEKPTKWGETCGTRWRFTWTRNARKR